MTGKENIKEHFSRVANLLLESRWPYTQEELDLLFYIMRNIRDGQEVYTFSVKDIVECSRKDRNHTRIRNSFRKLGSKTLDIDFSDNEWEMFWLFRSVRMSGGQITVHLSESILPMLCELKKNYSLVEINGGFRLNGKYSKRLYLLLSRWKNLKSSRVYDIADLKDILKYGNSSGQISDFKRAIRTAVDDINSSTCLHVESEWIKTGKTVTHVKFNMKKTSGRPLEESDELKRMKELLLPVGLSEYQIGQLFSEGCTFEKASLLYKRVDSSLLRRDVKLNCASAYVLECFRQEGYLGEVHDTTRIESKRKVDPDIVAEIRNLIELGTSQEAINTALRNAGLVMQDIIDCQGHGVL